MVSIANHQRNANQNHNEIATHTCQNGYRQKEPQITNVGEDVEEREISYTVGGNVNWYRHCGKQYGSLSRKLEIELPYDPAIPLLDMSIGSITTPRSTTYRTSGLTPFRNL